MLMGVPAKASGRRVYRIAICCCRKLTDGAVADISTLSRLQALKLSECELIGDAGVQTPLLFKT